MTTYDVLNEAAIAATPADIVGALLAEAAGRSRWWQPFLVMRQQGDKSLPEIGAVVDIAVSGRRTGGPAIGCRAFFRASDRFRAGPADGPGVFRR